MTVTAGNDTDLVILGATPGGITAAIAAARLSRTSVLLELTAYIGGLPANGLGATDIATRGTICGLFLEFVHKIKAHYISVYGRDSDQVRDCDDGYHFEPSVAEHVFHNWLREYPQIKVLTRRQFDFEPENVELCNKAVTSVKVTNLETDQVETIRGHFFIDASYEGDLIAAAGVPFLLGREGKMLIARLAPGGYISCGMDLKATGSTHTGDNAVQAYNYRLCLTDYPENRIEISRPTKYHREEFVSLVRDVKTGLHTGVDVGDISPDQAVQNIKRAGQNQRPILDKLGGIRRLLSNVHLPNHKVDGNNQHLAFISTDLPEENWPYPISSWAWRDSFAKRLREYTEGLLYFAQNDPALPLWFRDECRRWGWAANEYKDNGHFPRQLYVREGRRMVGKHVFTANDVLTHGVHKATITASHYALDSHAVRKREPGRVHLDGFFSYRCKPYTVPYGVMVPDAPITNLLAPIPVSATHVGFKRREWRRHYA